MYKGDTVPGVLVSVLGIIFMIATLTNTQLTIAPVTSDGVPGAGFFPFLLSALLIVLGSVLILSGIRQKGEVKYFNLTVETKQNLKILLLVVIGLVVFLIFWKLTHFFYLGVLLVSLYLNKVFKRNLSFILIYSVIFTAFIYMAFTMGFSIQFT